MPILEIFPIFAPIFYVSLNFNALMIQILVFMSKDSEKYGEHVYERLVHWDSSIRFPVEETITAMRALYGRKAIVDIKFFGEN